MLSVFLNVFLWSEHLTRNLPWEQTEWAARCCSLQVPCGERSRTWPWSGTGILYTALPCFHLGAGQATTVLLSASSRWTVLGSSSKRNHAGLLLSAGLTVLLRLAGEPTLSRRSAVRQVRRKVSRPGTWCRKIAPKGSEWHSLALPLTSDVPTFPPHGSQNQR